MQRARRQVQRTTPRTSSVQPPEVAHSIRGQPAFGENVAIASGETWEIAAALASCWLGDWAVTHSLSRSDYNATVPGGELQGWVRGCCLRGVRQCAPGTNSARASDSSSRRSACSPGYSNPDVAEVNMMVGSGVDQIRFVYRDGTALNFGSAGDYVQPVWYLGTGDMITNSPAQ